MHEDWDVFVSHASEDKDDIARPLAAALKSFGLKVWFDELQLKVGDSLSESIASGLSRSSFGIVILSPAFFSKSWTKQELRGLFAQSIGERRKILPIWHGVNRRDVLDQNPMLADLLAENTNQPLEHLALKIVEVVKPELTQAILRKVATSNRSRNAEAVVLDASQIKSGPIRHPKLPQELVRRILIVRHILAEVYPGSPENWIESFQRDTHPTREVEIWERIALAFARTNELVELSGSERHELYVALLGASLAGSGAFQSLASWSTMKLDAVLDAVTPHPEYFAVDEREGYQVSEKAWLDIEVFEGDAALLDQKYIDEVAKILADLKLRPLNKNAEA